MSSKRPPVPPVGPRGTQQRRGTRPFPAGGPLTSSNPGSPVTQLNHHRPPAIATHIIPAPDAEPKLRTPRGPQFAIPDTPGSGLSRNKAYSSSGTLASQSAYSAMGDDELGSRTESIQIGGGESFEVPTVSVEASADHPSVEITTSVGSPAFSGSLTARSWQAPNNSLGILMQSRTPRTPRTPQADGGRGAGLLSAAKGHHNASLRSKGKGRSHRKGKRRAGPAFAVRVAIQAVRFVLRMLKYARRVRRLVAERNTRIRSTFTIQCFWRRQCQIRRMRQRAAAKRIANYLKRLVQKNLRIQAMAATSIQRVWRGKLGRNKVKQLLFERDFENVIKAMTHKAERVIARRHYKFLEDQRTEREIQLTKCVTGVHKIHREERKDRLALVRMIRETLPSHRLNISLADRFDEVDDSGDAVRTALLSRKMPSETHFTMAASPRFGENGGHGVELNLPTEWQWTQSVGESLAISCEPGQSSAKPTIGITTAWPGAEDAPTTLITHPAASNPSPALTDATSPHELSTTQVPAAGDRRQTTPNASPSSPSWSQSTSSHNLGSQSNNSLQQHGSALIPQQRQSVDQVAVLQLPIFGPPPEISNDGAHSEIQVTAPDAFVPSDGSTPSPRYGLGVQSGNSSPLQQSLASRSASPRNRNAALDPDAESQSLSTASLRLLAGPSISRSTSSMSARSGRSRSSRKQRHQSSLLRRQLVDELELAFAELLEVTERNERKQLQTSMLQVLSTIADRMRWIGLLYKEQLKVPPNMRHILRDFTLPWALQRATRLMEDEAVKRKRILEEYEHTPIISLNRPQNTKKRGGHFAVAPMRSSFRFSVADVPDDSASHRSGESQPPSPRPGERLSLITPMSSRSNAVGGVGYLGEMQSPRPQIGGRARRSSLQLASVIERVMDEQHVIAFSSTDLNASGRLSSGSHSPRVLGSPRDRPLSLPGMVTSATRDTKPFESKSPPPQQGNRRLSLFNNVPALVTTKPSAMNLKGSKSNSQRHLNSSRSDQDETSSNATSVAPQRQQRRRNSSLDASKVSGGEAMSMFPSTLAMMGEMPASPGGTRDSLSAEDLPNLTKRRTSSLIPLDQLLRSGSLPHSASNLVPSSTRSDGPSQENSGVYVSGEKPPSQTSLLINAPKLHQYQSLGAARRASLVRDPHVTQAVAPAAMTPPMSSLAALPSSKSGHGSIFRGHSGFGPAFPNSVSGSTIGSPNSNRPLQTSDGTSTEHNPFDFTMTMTKSYLGGDDFVESN